MCTMREECHGVYCNLCPYGPEPKAVHTCPICGRAIYEGENCYEMDGVFYHEDCFEYSAVDILEKECGATCLEATSELKCACGDVIYAGEMYYDMDGTFYHKDCLEDNAVDILEDDCGAFMTEARAEEW